MRKNVLLLTLLSCLVICSAIFAGEQEKPKEEQEKGEQSPMELFRAIFRNDAKKVEELISQGADCNVILGRFLPLNIALQRGCIDAAFVLIRNGALIDGKDNQGGTPLSYIIGSKPEEWSKYTEVTRLLLDKGIDVNAGDDQGITLLHRAAAAGRKDIVSLFFAHGGDIAVEDNKGRTLLQYAIASGSKDTVSFFLAHGADIDEKDDTGRTLLHFAAGTSVPYAESHSNLDIVQLLLGREINVDEVDSQLRKLLSASIDVNVQDEHGIAPLHIAASAGHSNTVKLLIAQGGRLNIKDKAGRTPLHYAAGAGSREGATLANMPDVMRILLDNNCFPSAEMAQVNAFG